MNALALRELLNDVKHAGGQQLMVRVAAAIDAASKLEGVR